MMRKPVLIIWAFCIFQSLAAQQYIHSMTENRGIDTLRTELLNILDNVEVNQDPRLEKMLKWHIENNRKKEGMDGFRVEIFFSSALNAKEQSLNKKKEFLSKYPEYHVHIKFIAPNFRVRVGDFRTKNEALKLYKKIEQDYPGAFIVSDIINFPLLKTEKYERPD
jgi:hypothetical protein